MKTFRSLKTAAVLLSVGGLGFGLIGSGVRAAMTDGGSASVSIKTGAVSCAVSSTDSNAVPSADGKSVTITLPPILASGSSSSYVKDMTVTNTGSLPANVVWSENMVTTGLVSGHTLVANHGLINYTNGTGNIGDPTRLETPLTLAPGAHQTYGSSGNGIGFQWTELQNGDLGGTATVTYTATCGEKPPLVAGSISFVGAADKAFTAGVAPHTTAAGCPGGYYDWISTNANEFCGTGAFPVASTTGFPSSGQLTMTASGGTATIAYTGLTATSFTGTTNVSGTGYVTPGATVTGSAPLPSIALPAGWQAGDMVVSYGLAGNVSTVPTGPGTWTQIGFGNSGYTYGYTDAAWHVLAAGDGPVVFPSVTQHGMIAVYRGVASIGGFSVSNPGNNQNWGDGPVTLAQTNGSSWVVAFGGDGTGTFNVAAAYAPALWGTTLRSSGFSDILTGLSDSGHGVTSWPGATYASGDYGHGGANWAVELVSK